LTGRHYPLKIPTPEGKKHTLQKELHVNHRIRRTHLMNLHLQSLTQSSPKASRFLGKIHMDPHEELIEKVFKSWVLGTSRLSSTISAQNFCLEPYGTAEMILAHEGTQMLITAASIRVNRWEEGLRNALAFRQYSNRGIVIMPTSGIQDALANSDIFVQAGIGLWELDEQTNEIVRHIHGKTTAPINRQANRQALWIIQRRLMQSEMETEREVAQFAASA